MRCYRPDIRYLLCFAALAGMLFLLDCPDVLADDHHFWRGGGSGGGRSMPLDAGGLMVVSALYSGIFAVCFAGFLLIHVWLAAFAVKLAWLFGLLAPLGVLLFLAGVTIPAGLWIFGEVLDSEQVFSLRKDGYEAHQLVIFCLLASILYHYALCVFLGLISPRPWGRTILRLYCLLLIVALILAAMKGSLLGLFLFLALCLAGHWIAWKIYERRKRALEAKQTRSQADPEKKDDGVVRDA